MATLSLLAAAPARSHRQRPCAARAASVGRFARHSPRQAAPARQRCPCPRASASPVALESVTDAGTQLVVAVICGGPSAERGISLNSARSLLDHLQSASVRVDAYYIDTALVAYSLSPAQLYCNTPSDFDFKLAATAERFGSLQAFAARLKATADIAFPAIHGAFGEDGGLQSLLESAGVPFVGTGASAAAVAFDKHRAATALSALGFPTLPSTLLESLDGTPLELPATASRLREWFSASGLDHATARVVVKPAVAGSSLGVSVAVGVAEAAEAAVSLVGSGLAGLGSHGLLNHGLGNHGLGNGRGSRVMVEAYAEGGLEFTAIVLGTAAGPVALLPTEVDISDSSPSDSRSRTSDSALGGRGLPTKTNRAIFDYRKKYLPSRSVRYFTPPRFPPAATDSIREGAERLFSGLGLRDVARCDGWLLPTGAVVYTDINLVSGMEQTSFLFQQCATAGLSHRGALRAILAQACRRSGVSVPGAEHDNEQGLKQGAGGESVRTGVRVLFGGDSSERQVSLMSGTNVWLKLRGLAGYDAAPFLLDSAPVAGAPVGSRTVWAVPYASVLRHTVEEVEASCDGSPSPAAAALRVRLAAAIGGGGMGGIDLPPPHAARRMTLDEFVQEAKAEKAVVFVAVHGGAGEDGRLQAVLEAAGVRFTGTPAVGSRLCMDKAATAIALAGLESSGVSTAPKVTLGRDALAAASAEPDARQLFATLSVRLAPGGGALCVKPASDGCSTGVAKLSTWGDLAAYAAAVRDALPRLAANSLPSAPHPAIEMPSPPAECNLFEPFIATDPIRVVMAPGGGEALAWAGVSRWVEVTVGVLGPAGRMRALTPSVTVRSAGDVLSLEEKFQGGTGINLTPPPESIMSPTARAAVMRGIESAARALGMAGFGRLDAFADADSGELLVIEANTVPGMTPSTVLYHQGLAESPPMSPAALLAAVVELGLAA